MKSDKKIAVITGSAGGLGKEFAQRLLRSGQYKVGLSDVNSSLGQETCSQFRGEFGDDQVTFIACDVTSLTSVYILWKETTEFFKTNSIDLWVNNAGVMGEKEGWNKCIDINLFGVLNGITTVMANTPAEADQVTILNVSSILGLFNVQQPKGWAYNTSKSAVVTASRCIGNDGKKNNFRMLCLCPSVTVTPILNGCTSEEIENMKEQVGGLMLATEVGAAFENLLKEGRNGDVMALWKDCPPYFIPDTSMALFIAYTTCAMMFRFTPASLTPTSVRPWPHMVLCAMVSIIGMYFLATLTMGFCC